MLGFIKGPNVKDWVKCWTNWMLREYNMGTLPTSERYWNTVFQAFQQAFIDSSARERAEDKLQHLSFIPGDVNTFIAQFESLAEEAQYPLDTAPTLTMFTSKLPAKMMEHIYKVVRPLDFMAWADAARQYHQDNMVVQNIRGIYEDTANKKKSTTLKTGFTAHQLAKILGVKMPSPGPDQMDTRVDRSRSKWCGNQKTRGRATTTEDPETQRKEGCCFTCNQQGHLACNCPKKPKEKKQTPPTKGRQAEAEDSESESEAESVHGASATVKWDKDLFWQMVTVAPEEDRVEAVRRCYDSPSRIPETLAEQ